MMFKVKDLKTFHERSQNKTENKILSNVDYMMYKLSITSTDIKISKTHQTMYIGLKMGQFIIVQNGSF